MISIFNFRRIEGLLRLVKGIEIEISPRIFPTESQDSNVVLYFVTPKKVINSPPIPVIYEKAGQLFESGLVYDHHLRIIKQFLLSIGDFETHEIPETGKPMTREDLISEFSQCNYNTVD